MSDLIDKHIVKIQLGVAIVSIMAIGTFVWRVSAYASTVDNQQDNILKQDQRITKIEDKLDNLATKDDLKTLRQDIKDFMKK